PFRETGAISAVVLQREAWQRSGCQYAAEERGADRNASLSLDKVQKDPRAIHDAAELLLPDRMCLGEKTHQMEAQGGRCSWRYELWYVPIMFCGHDREDSSKETGLSTCRDFSKSE